MEYRQANGRLWCKTVIGTFEIPGPLQPLNPFQRLDPKRAYPERHGFAGWPSSALELRLSRMTPEEKLARWQAVRFGHPPMIASRKRRIAELKKEIRDNARATKR